jgi:hypothetical protein
MANDNTERRGGLLRDWPKTKGEFAVSVVVIIGVTLAVMFVAQHARIPLILVEASLHLMFTGIALAAFYFGKMVTKMRMKRWAAFGGVYLVTCLLALILWLGHGSEDDRRPSRRESSEFAAEIFFTIIPAALFGAYRAIRQELSIENG